MHLPPLLAAVERGDDIAVFDLLDDVPKHEVAGDDGVTLLAAAAYAGRHEVVWQLVDDGVDAARSWPGGIDPVTWAAERGAYRVLQSLLIRGGDPSRAGSPHRRALRVAQEQIDVGSDAADEAVPPAHRAIVSHLEAVLGIHRCPDELMARALFHGRPDHDDWFESLLQLGMRVRTDPQLFGWACDLAGESSSLARRRFGLDTLHFLSFGIDPPVDEEPAGECDHALPFTWEEAAGFLRPLLATEQDPHALRTVISAFVSYSTPEEARAVLVHACHRAPEVRGCVARALAATPSLVTSDFPDVLAALLRLTEDPEDATRASALYAFTGSPVDSPELRAVLAAHLTDPYFDARLEAAAALALLGDACGLSALDELRRGLKNHRSPGADRLDIIDRRLRVRARARDRSSGTS